MFSNVGYRFSAIEKNQTNTALTKYHEMNPAETIKINRSKFLPVFDLLRRRIRFTKLIKNDPTTKTIKA